MSSPRASTVRKKPVRRSATPGRTTRSASPATISTTDARDFSRRLRAWFRRHGRDLPWRRTRDAYHVLVSELMLQQTQVSRVLDFYPGFIARFPDLESLAAARPAHVLAEWQGLGYYARARNLHKLARQVVREAPPTHGGVLPSEPHALRALPGVGAYTAGAVASFAYEKRAALVDTNVARVLQRYFAPALSPKRPRDLKRLWAIAEAILPRTGRTVWEHNQAMMELGALVCTARVAKCGECPLASTCRSAGDVDDGSEGRGRTSRPPGKGK